MMLKRKAQADKTRCVACGACTQVCPRGAVSVWRGSFARVDAARCIGCGSCVRTCPADAMSLKEAVDG